MKKINKEYTVGIVMPCYNLGEYINEALDSLSKQTFQDFHVIIVDDVSNDMNTVKILKQLSLPENAELVFEKKNLGLSGVRNKYMHKFKTKYVFSFDPDDILDPLFLEKSVAYLESHPDKAAVAPWLDRFGIETGVSKLSEELASLPSMLINNHYLGSCVLRKEVFEQIGGYDTNRIVYGAEDYDFWLSVLENGWSLGVIPEPLFKYRRLENSSSSQSARPERAIEWRKYIVKKHSDLYKKYLLDVVLGYEKRAGEAHTGYLETYNQLTLISKDYEALHTYVEDDLVPRLKKYEAFFRKFRFLKPSLYIAKIRQK